MFVSKMRSWIRALGTWSERVETQNGVDRKKGKYKAIRTILPLGLKRLGGYVN